MLSVKGEKLLRGMKVYNLTYGSQCWNACDVVVMWYGGMNEGGHIWATGVNQQAVLRKVLQTTVQYAGDRLCLALEVGLTKQL